MDQITMRSRPRVPAVNCGSGASSTRIDRHLAVLAGPAIPQRDTEEAILLMREIARRGEPGTTSVRGAQVSKVSLFAPLRRLRRSLFGNRG